MAETLSPREGSVAALGPHGFTRVAYYEWGPRDAAQVVVCVHGLTRNARDFDFLARRLAQRGLRVIAPDLPGRGKSEWVPTAADYATPLYLAAMTAIIARSGAESVDWIGTSLGGHVGMEMAALAGAPIRRLLLNDFGARVGGTALQRISSYMRVKRRFESVEDLEAHLRSVHAPFGHLTDAQWRHLAEHSAVKTEDGDYRQHYDPAIGRAFSWPLMVDIVLWNVWDQVACPVLVLRGEDSDLLHASTVREMQKRGIAGKNGLVRAVEVREVGHAPALMNDAQISIVEEFLADDKATSKAERVARLRAV
ncbi:MAG: alpha/beta hydrolase [Burkholderiales bacterium]|nr:alpha/beta hydrolase [Burkholderiales bacterium]